MMNGYFTHGWGMGIGWFVGFILMILVIYFLMKASRYGDQTNITNTSRTALDILNERYAKGEINKEEYEAKKKDILSA